MTGRTPLACLVILAALIAALLFSPVASAGNCDVKCQPMLQVEKWGPSYVAQGAPATYHFSVWNNTPGDVTNVQLTDDECSPVTKDFGQDGDVLPADETWYYTCTYTPTGAVGDTVTNHASATADDVAEGFEVDSNVATHDTTIVGLDVTKTVDKLTADPFDTLNYTIVVTNNGPQGVYFSGYVNDDQCAPVSTDDHTDGNYYDDLMPGDSITFTCTHIYDPAEDGSSFTNTACVTGSLHFFETAASVATIDGENGVEKCASATTTLATHTVSGQKFEDMNADGVRQLGEPALPGQVVYADLNNNGKRDEGEPSSTSDGQGNWSLGVELGTTVIREDVVSPFTCSFPSGCAYTIDLPKNSPPPPPDVPSRALANKAVDPTGKDFGDWRPATVSGTVVDDQNGNGSRDTGESGLAGVPVFADLDNNGTLDAGEPTATSAADGTYAISGLKPGGYVIRQVIPAGRTCSAPAGNCSYSLTLVSNGNEPNKDFLDVPQATQAVLGARIIPGVARMTAPTGCVTGTGFSAGIRGRKMQRVTFSLDGKTVKSFVLPKDNKTYRVHLNATKLRTGAHTVSARVTFMSGTGTKSKTIRLTFQRCARQVRAPQFTG